MFLNPSTTGLILIGASHFANYSDHDRQSFSHAYRTLKNYFLQPGEGLYLLADNVLDLFNSDLSASDQIDTAKNFVIEQNNLQDLFVYIVTHGKVLDYNMISEHDLTLKTRYMLKVRQSCDRNDAEIREDTHIDFETLYVDLFHTMSMRKYFIVDACDSGAIHLHMSETALHIDPFVEPAEVFDYHDHQSRGATILTANNSEKIGLVYGTDKNELPLFTYCLVSILENGVKEGFRHGLSFNALRYFINQCCKKKMGELDVPVSNLAQVSDRDWDAPGVVYKGVAPSDVPIFPNNDAENRKHNYIVSNIRKALHEATGEKSRWEKIKSNNHKLLQEQRKLEDQQEELIRKNNLLIQNLEEVNEKLVRQTEKTEHYRGAHQVLERAQKRLMYLLGVIILVPITLYTVILLARDDWTVMFIDRIMKTLNLN